MKLPVVWLACSFAAGIALALALPHALPTASWSAAAVVMMMAGSVAAWRGRVAAAWACALAAWLALGGTAVELERASVSADHVTRLIEAGRLDTSEPLRWRVGGCGKIRSRCRGDTATKSAWKRWRRRARGCA